MLTLGFFLILYAIAIALFFLYALFNLFHVLRFGHFDRTTYFVTGTFIAGFLFILFVSYVFIGQIDWTTPIHLLGGNSVQSIPTTQF